MDLNKKKRSFFALIFTTVLSPSLGIYASLVRLLKIRGWKFAAIVCSVMGNILFLLAIVLALTSPDHDTSRSLSRQRKNASVPEGLALRSQGPLYFAEFTTDSALLGPSIVVLFHGCIVAAFDFVDGLSAMTDVQVYDDQCRSRTNFDVRSGAFHYTVYGLYSDPQYSVIDEDADGLPDRKVNWVTKKSFKRSAPIEWKDVTVDHTNDVTGSEESGNGD